MRRLHGAAATFLAVSLFGCAAGSKTTTRDWVSPKNFEHPLVGRVWDVRASKFVELKDVERAARDADFVLLGESHDNADHHLLQATLVRAITSNGRRPAIAFEMLDTPEQNAVNKVLSEKPGDMDAFATAVDWANSGWPEFSLYRPIFVAAADAQLPIIAANLPRPEARAAVHDGPMALDHGLRTRLEQQGPPSAEMLESMREEIRESHCDALPEEMIDPMVLVQRAKDAQLSLSLVAGATPGGAILITGAGHARNDRGVPTYLAKDAPGRSVLSVGFLEAEADAATPADYAKRFGGAALPFDYVVWTPGADRGDPCAAFREHHKTM